MTTALVVRAHPAGRRIDLEWRSERAIPAVADVPTLRLVRRRLAYPVGPEDGSVVIELPDLYFAPSQPWARLERWQFRTVNTPTPDGALEADLTLYFEDPAPSEPAQARLAVFDDASQSVAVDLVTECSRVVRTAGPAAGWQDREALELFRTPGGGPEEPGGVLEIFQGNDDPTIANRVVWTPAAGPVRTADFDAMRRWLADRTEAALLTYETRAADGDPGLPWLTIAVAQDLDAGTEAWSIEVQDRDLDPLVEYYYALFDLASAEPLLAHAVALATQDHDSPRRLFLRLPGAYQRADEPDPTRPTGAPGPLRRFLQPVGHTVDLGRSLADGARTRHDSGTVRVDLLPRLARMIGWEPDLAAPGEVQRRDVRAAPEVFGSAGTDPNVRALVHRVTRWPCRVKEFVNNVFLTNAPERVRLWELGEIQHDGTSWGTPAGITVTNDVDARPALALDGAGVVWVFWHSDRGGRRALWRQRRDGVDAAPVLARAGASDDTAEFTAVDQDPAAAWDGSQMWVFWSSNREEQWDIWARTFVGSPPVANDPIRLTDHPAEDRAPAAVLVPGPPDRLWVFWSSRRRGTADVWARALDVASGIWGDAERLTDSPLRDDSPAAAVDGSGRLWLFWTRDAGGRQTLWYRILDAGVWTAETPLDMGHRRDDSPAAVAWKGGILLLWHSDHDGPWQIWGRFHDLTEWLDPARIDPDVTGNKEPAAVVDAATRLRVVWRSQRRARWYRSRTLDLDDPEVLAEMGTFTDHAHYVYDCRRKSAEWDSMHPHTAPRYARDMVGLYLTPDALDAPTVAKTIERTAGFVEPFRAAVVRYVWPDDGTHEETIEVGVFGGESWSDVP